MPNSQDQMKQLLWELHEAVAESFLKMVRSDEPAKASMCSVICQFLRDNGITVQNKKGAGSIEEALLSLNIEDLPFPS